MSKKLKDLKWESVTLEGFPASIKDNLQGFVGLEECTEYGFDKDAKRPKKKKPQKKRKTSSTIEKEVPNKKVKLSNGFVVENCTTITPSLPNEETRTKPNKTEIKTNKKPKQGAVKPTESCSIPSNVESKKKKTKLGEDLSEKVSALTPEDMLSWAEYKLPEPIMKALMELGFKRPTKIQELTLPAAIHGRRDILGAAETGSGKTLAFGLPILTGIMKLKEKAEMGLDVYEMKYKKNSGKKKQAEEKPKNNNENKKNNKEKNQKQNGKEAKLEDKPIEEKEPSEDGYSSDDEGDNHENTDEERSEEEFLEEYDVPIKKKKEISTDEGNESDNSDENYIHLSDMLDSDDLADTDDEQNEGEENDSGAEEESSDIEENESEKSSEGNESDVEDNVDENEQGIGCVKVVDDIAIPGHSVVKTGKPLYALILTPTRELAIQISGHLRAVAKYTGIKVCTIVGGMAEVKQERVLRSGPEIVVATPGRLWELAKLQPHLQQLDTVKFLAIDETDRMVERNHFQELYPLLERLNADEEQRGGRQNFVFSATLTMVHDLPAYLRRKKVTKHGKIINRKVEKMTPQQKIKRLVTMVGMTEPKVVDITQKNLGTAETLTESRIACSREDKDCYLYYILKKHPGRTLVFCNSIGSVKRLTQLLTILKCKPLPLHASLDQRQRLRNLERFRDHPQAVAVATDVAARGLDIPAVSHVVHYHVPTTAENYVHRSGRTARASSEGLAILMMEPAEASLYAKLCRTLNNSTELPLFPVPSSALPALRSLMSLARSLDALELSKRRAAAHAGWREKAARDMDMIIDEDDVPLKQVDPSIEKALRAKRRDLNILLSRSLVPRDFSLKFPTLNQGGLEQVPEDALQVMKKSLESGEQKKQKRRSKNEPLLKLEKTLKKKQ